MTGNTHNAQAEAPLVNNGSGGMPNGVPQVGDIVFIPAIKCGVKNRYLRFRSVVVEVSNENITLRLDKDQRLMTFNKSSIAGFCFQGHIALPTP